MICRIFKNWLFIQHIMYNYSYELVFSFKLTISCLLSSCKQSDKKSSFYRQHSHSPSLQNPPCQSTHWQTVLHAGVSQALAIDPNLKTSINRFNLSEKSHNYFTCISRFQCCQRFQLRLRLCFNQKHSKSCDEQEN